MGLPTFEEKGLLPVGVEVDGEVHREYTLRATKVADLIASEVWPGEHSRRASLFTRQITRLGNLEPGQITMPLMQRMEYVDYHALQLADARLTRRQQSFREESEKPAEGPGVTG